MEYLIMFGIIGLMFLFAVGIGIATTGTLLLLIKHFKERK